MANQNEKQMTGIEAAVHYGRISQPLTDEEIERLAVAEGVKFRRIYRPGNKSWTDMTESTVERDALIRIVRAALTAR